MIGWAGLVLSVVLAIVTVQAFRFNRREREAALCLELWGLYRNRSWQEVRADLAVGQPRLDEDQWRKDFDDMVSFLNVLGRMVDAGVLRRATISSMFYSLPSLWNDAEPAISTCRVTTPTYGVDFEKLQKSLRRASG